MIKYFGRIFFTLLALQTSVLATVQLWEDEQSSYRTLGGLLPKETWSIILLFRENQERLNFRLLSKESSSIVEETYKMESQIPSFNILNEFKNKKPFYPFTHSLFLREFLGAKAVHLKCDPGSEIEMIGKHLEERVCKLYGRDNVTITNTLANISKEKGRDQFEFELLYKVQKITNMAISKKIDLDKFIILHGGLLDYLRNNLTLTNNPLDDKKKVCTFYMKKFLNYLFSVMAPSYHILNDYLSRKDHEILRMLGVNFSFAGDLSKGEEYFKRSLEKGNLKAYYDLAVCFEQKGDKKNAFKYYQLATDHGFSYAQNNLAILFLRNGDLENALKHFKIGADQGHIEAQCNLGGLLIETDEIMAYNYTKLAADKGHFLAQYNLGYLFEKKKNDLKSAFIYYQLAAGNGNMNAKDALARIASISKKRKQMN